MRRRDWLDLARRLERAGNLLDCEPMPGHWPDWMMDPERRAKISAGLKEFASYSKGKANEAVAR